MTKKCQLNLPTLRQPSNKTDENGAKEDPTVSIALEIGLGMNELSDYDEAVSNSMIQEIHQRLDELLPLEPITTEATEEPRILYELLDEVPNGRKVMNHIFHSATGLQVDTQELYNGHFHRTASRIADRWYEEEKRASTQALPAALQLDAPVIFSWSKKGSGTKNSPQKNTPDSSVRETTNQTLFKSIAGRLSEIAKQRDVLQDGFEEHEGSERAQTSPSKQRWAKSEFHVDPLQEFVVTSLPRPKKETSDKKKAKRRSILNFWGGNNKKKEERKSTTTVPVRDSTEQPEPLEEINMENALEHPKQDFPKQEIPVSSPGAMSLNSFIPLQPKKK